MATIVLTAVGGLIGGPIGAAIGSFAGQQVDAALFGTPGGREGPRLKDLAVTTSTYGNPIARHFGVMRVPGTIIWSTDLIETRQTSGGGKGKPKTTTYGYRASFAVALGSRPIVSVGRIWADGSLLRGAAGDLKSPGSMRVHLGYGDQPVDPLIASAKGIGTPAFRDLAYIVFEDLELGEFGNRIPALTFEVFSDPQNEVKLGDLVPAARKVAIAAPLPNMLGYSDEGGSLLASLTAIDRVYPLICKAGEETVEILPAYEAGAPVAVLPEALQDSDPEEGGTSGIVQRQHASGDGSEARALRYYDRDRDHQPGIQRAVGRQKPGREQVLDLPAAMTSFGARALCSEYAQRSRWQGETLVWRVADLDHTISPGDLAMLPNQPGIWLVRNWEWSDQGIELSLERTPPSTDIVVAGHPGELYPPPDLQALPTILRTFELPWDGLGSSASPSMFAALSAEGDGWTGAALFLEQAGALLALESTPSARSMMGQLATELPPSNASYFDANAAIEVELVAGDLALASITLERLAAGDNRLLVGAEVIQFAQASQLSATRWRLSGLLRGRGGTEHYAMAGHPVGSNATLLDDALIPLDPSQVPSSPTTRLAALGFGDDQPVYVNLEGSGTTRRPIAPVHPSHSIDALGDWQLTWVRRSRGQWHWEDYVETPLVEEQEAYQIGIGLIDQPIVTWQSSVPSLTIDGATISALHAAHGPQPAWVRQVGTYGLSPATLIAQIS